MTLLASLTYAESIGLRGNAVKIFLRRSSHAPTLRVQMLPNGEAVVTYGAEITHSSGLFICRRLPGMRSPNCSFAGALAIMPPLIAWFRWSTKSCAA